MAGENMVANAVEPRGKGDGNEENMDTEEESSDEQEFQALNAQLDQLNSVLDNLETKTDGIQAELVELLKSNKETRKQFQDSSEKGDPTTQSGSEQ